MMETHPSYIHFASVQKAFEKNVIYENLTLSINRGETLVLLGPSGTGKSVMLKMLIGLLQPDAGEIYFDGTEVSKLSEKEWLPVRKKISMLFQGGALFDSMSVGDNVAFPLREHFKMSEKDISRRVGEKLEVVGLPGIENRKPGELSGGMKKRVALARAIVADPEVVLYDEPTTGLDPINTHRISQLILTIQKEFQVTSLVVTHDIPSAFMVADQMAMLSEKRILTMLPKEEFRRSQNRTIREFIDAMEPMSEALSKADQEKNSKEKQA